MLEKIDEEGEKSLIFQVGLLLLQYIIILQSII